MRTSQLHVPFCSKCKNSIFCDYNNPLHTIGDIFQSKKIVKYDKDEYLYFKDDTSAGIYCIYSGGVKIVDPISLSQDITIHIAGNGEIIGLNSIKARHHVYSAVATEETEICFIPLYEVTEMMNVFSNLSEKIQHSKY
jgi:CRP-like cAMP-binding protein